MASVDLLTAFIVGLLGGVHCVGMCGGIVSALSLGQPQGRPATLLSFQLAYNLGRISSYVIAGALMGAVGFFFSAMLPVQMGQKVLLSVAAVFLILLGLYLAGWLNWLARIEQVGGVLWKRIEPLGRGLLPVRSLRQALALGLLWGWLPCGLVYTALVWTVSSGGALKGALLMLAFGFGTLPNLLLMGSAASWLARFTRKPHIRQIAGALILVYGCWLLWASWS